MTRIGESPAPAASAASAMAGAVLRAAGSTRIRASLMPAAAKSALAWPTWPGPHTMSGAAKRARSAVRSSVCRNMLRLPVSGRNCLGCAAVDNGHSRVPEPPERMTGMMAGWAPVPEDAASVMRRVSYAGQQINASASSEKSTSASDEMRAHSPMASGAPSTRQPAERGTMVNAVAAPTSAGSTGP